VEERCVSKRFVMITNMEERYVSKRFGMVTTWRRGVFLRGL